MQHELILLVETYNLHYPKLIEIVEVGGRGLVSIAMP